MKDYKRGTPIIYEDELWFIRGIWDKYEGLYEIIDYDGKNVGYVGSDEFKVFDQMTKTELQKLVLRLLDFPEEYLEEWKRVL